MTSKSRGYGCVYCGSVYGTDRDHVVPKTTMDSQHFECEYVMACRECNVLLGSHFLLEAGINAAEESLVDRRLFQLDDAQWQAFQDVLDRPVTEKPRLARLLSEKSVLE